MKMRHGFSLIELMVVIAIIAVLSAIALPSYKAYMGRATVAKSLTVMNTVMDQIIDLYNQGKWDCNDPPATIKIYGTQVPRFTFTQIPALSDYVAAIGYGGNYSIFTCGSNEVGWIGYVEMHLNRLYTVTDRFDGRGYDCLVGKDSNGIIQKVCGKYDNSNNVWDVPTDLLPVGADCMFSTGKSYSTNGPCTSPIYQ